MGISGSERIAYRESSFEEIINIRLKDLVFQKYPLVKDASSRVLSGYLNQGNNIPYCSFKFDGDQSLIQKILDRALVKGSDPTDKAYCVHASKKHKRFIKVVQQLREDVFLKQFKIKKYESCSPARKFITETRFMVIGSTQGIYGRDEVGVVILHSLSSYARECLSNTFETSGVARYIDGELGNLATTKVITAYFNNLQFDSLE